MMRNFKDIVEQISNLMPASVCAKLRHDAYLWEPKLGIACLTDFVNKYVVPDINDSKVVKIYSILMDRSEEEIIRRFKNIGV